MSTINIRRTHHLSHPRLVTVANKIAAELEQEFGIAATWADANTLKVRGSGLSGELHLAQDEVELNIKLGLVMAMFADKIRKGVEEKFDKLFAAKPAKKK